MFPEIHKFCIESQESVDLLMGAMKVTLDLLLQRIYMYLSQNSFNTAGIQKFATEVNNIINLKSLI